MKFEDWFNSRSSHSKAFIYTTILAWWNLRSSKLKESEAKLNRKTQKQSHHLNDSVFVLFIAPPLFSCEKMIKMKKLIIKSHHSSFTLDCFISIFCFLILYHESNLYLYITGGSVDLENAIWGQTRQREGGGHRDRLRVPGERKSGFGESMVIVTYANASIIDLKSSYTQKSH